MLTSKVTWARKGTFPLRPSYSPGGRGPIRGAPAREFGTRLAIPEASEALWERASRLCFPIWAFLNYAASYLVGGPWYTVSPARLNTVKSVFVS
jgi:hypothetical protein